MKKLLIIISMFLFLCGCGKTSEENIVKKFQQKIEKNEAYILKGNMSILSNEDTFNYSVEASKSKDCYYKVSLVNKTNDHEQVILKNSDGVYVVTPDLNKSFKFQSDWPNNGSQSYLLDVLLSDVLNDDNVHVEKGDNKYIQCRVNYPNNNTLYSEKIYLDDDYSVKKVEVLDQDGNVKITLDVTSINYKPKFDDDYFALESLVTDDTEEDQEENTKQSQNKETETENSNENNSESTENDTIESEKSNVQNSDNNSEESTSSSILEDIIYPLYVPQNTHLSTQDTINTDSGNRAILTFAGDSPFVLVEEISQRFDEMEIIPVNGDPLMMSDSIGALSSNSLYWTSNGIDYYISSSSLDSEELMTIAEGLSGTSVIVSSEK